MTKQWLKYWVAATPFIMIFCLLLIVERPLAWLSSFFEWMHDKMEDCACFLWEPFRNRLNALKIEARKSTKKEARHD